MVCPYPANVTFLHEALYDKPGDEGGCLAGGGRWVVDGGWCIENEDRQ